MAWALHECSFQSCDGITIPFADYSIRSIKWYREALARSSSVGARGVEESSLILPSGQVSAANWACPSFDHDDAGIAHVGVSISIGGRDREDVDPRTQRARVPWEAVPYVRAPRPPRPHHAHICPVGTVGRRADQCAIHFHLHAANRRPTTVPLSSAQTAGEVKSR